jgi:hypothetical protein
MSRSMLTRFVARAALAAPVALATPAHAFLYLDDFVTQQTLQLPAGGLNSASSSTLAPEVVGGERDVQITRTIGNDPVDLLVNPTGSDRLLSLSSAAATIATWTVVWDGPDGSASVDADGLGGLDLTQGGVNTGFLIRVRSDLPSTLEIAATGASGGATSASLQLPGGEATLQQRFLAFSEFATPALFADTGSVSLVLTGSAGTDAQLDYVLVTVPEASGAAAAGAALLALACRRRRHVIRSPRG